jgi:hypothetical protein
MLTIDDNDDIEPICYSLFIESEKEDSDIILDYLSNIHQSSHGFVKELEINTLSENDNDLSYQKDTDGLSNTHQPSHGFVEELEINTLSEDDNELEINTLSEDDNDLSHQEDAGGLHDADDSVNSLDEKSSEDECHDWIIDSRTNITADTLTRLQILNKGTVEIFCKISPYYGESTHQDQMGV